MHTCAIVNPVAGGGRARRRWPQLLSCLQEVASSLSVRWTTGPDSATSLARQALKEGTDRIVAVGGDGTLHEVVNGFFENEALVAPSAVLAFVACGSGSDFRRALGTPTGVDAVQQLRSAPIQRLDLLRVQYTTEKDCQAHCYAINIASTGLSGTVVRNFSRGSLPLPPRLRYFWAALWALASDHPFPLRLTLDGEPLPPTHARLVAVANGHSFAAGLPIAPAATPNDGLFDVTVLHDAPIFSLLRRGHRFYQGTHTSLDEVTTYRGRHLTIHPLDTRPPPWLEADGEALGLLPATVELLPQALRVQH